MNKKIDKNKKMIKEIKKKGKRTVALEREDLVKRQECLRKKKAELEKNRDELYKAIIDDIKTNGISAGTADIIRKQIDIITEQIVQIDKELEENGQAIEVYSTVLKNDSDRFTGKVNSATGVLTGLGALGLGVWSAGKIYKTDLQGNLYNKGIKDFFGSLLHLRIFK